MAVDLKLNQAGRDHIATALILLKDFLSNGQMMDVVITRYIHDLAHHLGLEEDMLRITARIPPLRIEPRHPDQFPEWTEEERKKLIDKNANK